MVGPGRARSALLVATGLLAVVAVAAGLLLTPAGTTVRSAFAVVPGVPGGTSSPVPPSPAASSALPSPSPSPSPPPPPELPRGGRELFGDYRLVGYSGGPGTKAFGRLGVGDIDERVDEIEKLGRSYTADDRTVMPVLELITVVVHGSAGKDGKYRSRIPDEVIEEYLAAARRHDALLLLNIQPGRAKFIDEVKPLRKWLLEPDVGLALDPEWAVKAPKVPGRSFGSVSGPELNEVAGWVSDLVEENDLPEKAVVVHQLRPSIVTEEAALVEHPGVAMIKSVDGIGPPQAKIDTWTALTEDMSPVFHPGFKLFFEEDAEGASRLMRAGEVMALTPTPEYVLYE